MRFLHIAVILGVATALATSGCRKHRHHHGGGGSSDDTAPAAVNDLSVAAAASNSLTLTWTARGDDGDEGQAAAYDLRYSLSPIIDEAGFASATAAPGVPAPLVAGSPSTFTVHGLLPRTTYWFALKSVDDAGNASPRSNCAKGTTLMPVDNTPPASVTDLAVVAFSSVDVQLRWTAPGDDGTTGTACQYDVRYSTAPIVTDSDFASAMQAPNPPLPSPPGEIDQMLVSGLTPGLTYWFALRSADDLWNWSGLSNVVSATTTPLDVTPPEAIADLSAGTPTFDSLTLAWTAPGDDGATGTAVSYDVRFSTNPIVTDADFDLAASAGVPPAPLAAGTVQGMVVTGLNASTTYWFAIKTSDEVPNVSALSNIATASTAPPPDTTPPADITDLAVTGWTDTSLTLSWTAPGDDGLVGTAAVYDIHCAQTPITTLAEFDAAFHLNGEPAPLAAGSTQTFIVTGLPPGTTWYFAIRTSDEIPNVSGLSNSASGTTSAFPVILSNPEEEPNNSTDTATPLGPDLAGNGTLPTFSDIDYWSFTANAGDLIRVELSGTRMSQAAWNDSDSIPLLRIVDPDGIDMMRHDRTLWMSGSHDLDVPLFRIPQAGTWFLRLQPSEANNDGRTYAVRVVFLPPNLTFEAEAPGTTGDNDSRATAEAVTTPATIYGWHANGESDYFKFDAVADSLLSFEITAYRNGAYDGEADYTNPRLWLYSPDGKKVEKISASIFEDVEFTYRVKTAGTWTIRVVEDGGCDGSGPYFLTINSVPVPGRQEVSPNGTPATADGIAYGDFITGSAGTFDTDWFSFNGAAGDMVRIKLYDRENDEDSSRNFTIELYASDGATLLPAAAPADILHTFRAILRESGTHYIRVSASGFASRYGIELLRHMSAAWEVEPNDDAGTARSFDAGRRGAGTISPGGDADVFQFSATERELASFAIYARRAAVPPGSDGDGQRSDYGSTLAPRLTIRDSGGNIVGTAVRTLSHVSAESITRPLPTFELVMVAPATGIYTITVEDQSGAGSATSSYILERR